MYIMGASLLYSQLGYYAQGEKQAFLRAPAADAPDALAGAAFALRDKDGQAAYTGALQAWGERWRSRWWVADFSAFTQRGEYTLDTPAGTSAPFYIGEDALSAQGLRTVALEQLEERRQRGVPGWRDCGSEIRELSSMVITVLALADLWDNPALLPYDRDRLLAELRHGVEAILASQEHWPDDPERDGRFNHDAFRMTNYGTTDYHNWHDTAYALTALARVLPVLRETDPVLARACLCAAERAYANALRRPYHLESDFGQRSHPEIDYTQDDFAPMVHDIAGKLYGKPEGWRIPTTLRTKEKLVFAHACCLLYEETGHPQYLDTAIAYADSACARQCRHRDDIARDGEGFFYEFEDDDEAFVVEFAHNHKFLMGNIEPVNLQALMKLARLLPDAPQVSTWLHTLHAYAHRYVKRTAALTPLSIYPQSVYSHPAHGGVHFFGMVVHGFTCLYGMIACNLFALSDFLQDEELARLGERNLLFAVGRNPGFPNAYDATAWTCKSLIKGVGSNAFGGHHGLSHVPHGSAMNGFAISQFDASLKLGDLPDEPMGILKPDNTYFFNEDYLPHSHGYVRGVARREQPARLLLYARDGAVPVRAEVAIAYSDGEVCDFTLNQDGTATCSIAPMRHGTLTLRHGDAVSARPFFAAPGGTLRVQVDFALCLQVAADAPLALCAGQVAQLSVRVTNSGTRAVDTALRLQASGASLLEAAFPVRLAPGETAVIPVALRGADAPTSCLLCRLPLYAGDEAQVVAWGQVA